MEKNLNKRHHWHINYKMKFTASQYTFLFCLFIFWKFLFAALKFLWIVEAFHQMCECDIITQTSQSVHCPQRRCDIPPSAAEQKDLRAIFTQRQTEFTLNEMLLHSSGYIPARQKRKSNTYVTIQYILLLAYIWNCAKCAFTSKQGSSYLSLIHFTFVKYSCSQKWLWWVCT